MKLSEVIGATITGVSYNSGDFEVTLILDAAKALIFKAEGYNGTKLIIELETSEQVFYKKRVRTTLT